MKPSIPPSIIFVLMLSGIICLTIGVSTYSTSYTDTTHKISCIIESKYANNFSCSDYVDLCDNKPHCNLVKCDTLNYNLVYNVIRLDINEKVLVCSSFNIAPTCRCCTETLISTCKNVILPQNNGCYPIITQVLDSYDKMIIGKTVDCWASETNIISFNDKDNTEYKLACNLMISGSILTIIGLVLWITYCMEI